MKTLKSIVEGVLGNIDADLDNNIFLNAISKKNQGWGGYLPQYDIKGDTLVISSKSTTPWTCRKKKFWELIKAAGIKRIESNCNLGFRDFSFEIDGISIMTSRNIYFVDCAASMRNCNIQCAVFGCNGAKIILDRTHINCIDDHNNMGDINMECLSTIEQKNATINCGCVNVMEYNLKGTDWGKYIESLGVVKFDSSGIIEIPDERGELNKNFIPLIPSTAELYHIYDFKSNHIYFEKTKSTDGLMIFKNGWVVKKIMKK